MQSLLFLVDDSIKEHLNLMGANIQSLVIRPSHTTNIDGCENVAMEEKANLYIHKTAE